MKSSIVLKAALILMVAAWLPTASYADVCVPADPDFDPVLCAAGGSGSGGPGGAPAAVPIDGGVSLLVAAGVAFAARKMRKAKPTTTEVA